MPIYEYECVACGHRLEVIQKFSDALVTDCPECNASSLKKLVSAAGFRLKGSGWYETDFKQGNKRNLAGKDKSDSDSSKSSDKSDKKISSETKSSKSGDSTSASKSSSSESSSK